MFYPATGGDGAQRQAERIAKEGRRPLGFVWQYSVSIFGALPAFIYPVQFNGWGLKTRNRRHECASDKNFSPRYPL